MQNYQDNLIGRINGALAPMKDVQVTVTDTATNLLAALYSDDGVTPLLQPLYTDENGLFSFYAADGKYTLTFSGKRVTTFTREVVLDDPAENPYLTAQELALVNGAAKVGYGERTVEDKLGELPSVKDSPFNGKGDGVTDDSAAVAAAQAASKAVRYPAGDFVGQSALSNLYGSYTKALGERIQSGTPEAPLPDAEPVVWVQKFSSADRTTNPAEWDNGAIYSMLVKKSGSAYGAGLTGAVRHEGGTGQMIGVHGRGAAVHADAQVWGGWSYVYNTTLGSLSMIGQEINIKNVGPDIGWQDLTINGNARGLVVVTADGGATPSQHAIYVGRHTGSGGWYTGFLNREDAIVPSGESVEIGNGEVYRIKGGSAQANRYGGIRFHTGHFQYALSTAEIPANNLLSNCAILLGKDHKIVFGTRPTNGSYLTWTSTNLVNAQGALGYGVNGTKVVGPQQTGFGAATGTTDKSAFVTYTAPGISNPPTQAEVQAIANALQAHSRSLGADRNVLINHGLAGA